MGPCSETSFYERKCPLFALKNFEPRLLHLPTSNQISSLKLVTIQIGFSSFFAIFDDFSKWIVRT